MLPSALNGELRGVSIELSCPHVGAPKRSNTRGSPLVSGGAAWVSNLPTSIAGEGEDMLIEILVILAIIALALFIWRNMVGRRV